MLIDRLGIVVVAAFVAAIVVSTVSASGPSGTRTVFPLTELTVAPDRLPAGCSVMAPPARRAEQVIVWSGLPIPTNPWVGADRSIVSAIHARTVRNPPAVPDGPPMTKHELAEFRLRMIADVEEAYAAVYTEGSPYATTVEALRYKAGAELPVQPARSTRSELRMTADRTLLAVTGPDGPCFIAVAAHVKDVAGTGPGRFPGQASRIEIPRRPEPTLYSSNDRTTGTR